MNDIKKKIVKSLENHGYYVRPDDLEHIDAGLLNYVFKTKTKPFLIIKYADEIPRIIDDFGTMSTLRLEREYHSIRLFSELGFSENVPHVLYYDNKFDVLVMRFDHTKSVDNELLNNRVDIGIIKQAAQIIAEVHSKTDGNRILNVLFSSNDLVEKLKIPAMYYNLSKDPVVQSESNMLAQEITIRKQCLIHGDFKTNNLLIKNGRVMFIDFEMTHFGNPVLDCCYPMQMYIHFAVLHQQDSDKYFDAIESFWKAYITNVMFQNKSKLEQDSIRHLGSHVLARLDGTPKLDFSQNEKTRNILRPLAKQMILGRVKRITDLRKIFDYYGSSHRSRLNR